MSTKEEIVETSGSSAAIQINDEEPTIKLDPAHEKILKEQLHTENIKISYLKLYSYATKHDWFLMGFGLICAAVSGAAVVSTFFFLKSLNFYLYLIF